MSIIGARSAGDLLGTIHAIWAIEDIDEFGPRVLEELEALMPSDLSSYNEVDPVTDRVVVIGRPVTPTPAQLESWSRWAHQNPCLDHMARTGDGSARRISDYLTTPQLHDLDLYREVYGPLGVEYQLAVALPAPKPLVIGIALNRRGGDFSDSEVELLDDLRPHLVQAYRKLQLMSHQRRALESVAGALLDDGAAFHVLDGPFTGPARALLDAYFGDHGLSESGLPLPVQSWLDQERDAFAAAGASRLRNPLAAHRDGRRLTLQYVPGGRGPDLLWLHERTPERDSRPLQRLGLSGREAEVLWRLTQGASTKEIAAQLGLSAGTVKKHLEHVYRKLGVSSRTAAVAQAFDVLAERPGPQLS